MINNNVRNLSQYGDNGLYGVYRGVVEDNLDPLRLARVKARVPMLHGVNGSSNYLDSSSLPWATPINPSGSGYDHGTCLVPEVGDTVFVMFEDNDRNYPLYLGGCYGKGGDSKSYGSDNDPSTYAGGTWTKPIGLAEIPNEVYNEQGAPTGKILYKSPKGSTIVIEEADGQESIRILDALGQSLKLGGSISNETNKNNGGRRINADASESCLPRIVTNNGYSEISLTDYKGQQIRMLNSDAGSSISIRSGSGGSGPKLVLEQDAATIEFSNNHIKILEKSAELLVSKNIISLNSDGSIDIKGSSTISIDANGNISIKGESMTLQTDLVQIDSDTCIIRGDLINYTK